MSLTTSLAASTATQQLLSFTTPFSEPEGCHVNERSTLTEVVDGTTSTLRYLISDPALPEFTSCQPSGWDSIIPESRFSFSPAVCPSGWATFEIGTTTREEDDEIVTTAWCCSSDFNLYRSNDYPLTTPGFSKPCEGQTSIPAPPGSAPILHLHHPWHITWHASDASASLLTPAPATLTAGETIAYLEENWADNVVPYTNTHTDTQTYQTNDGLTGLGLAMGLGLGLGLGGGLLLVAVCIWSCRCRGTTDVDP
ncbi:hypothetical protein BJX65DRAFT_303984 [Aspergillus insuetus]